MHGLLLSSVVVAGTAGPALLSTLRQNEVTRAIHDLVASIEPATCAARGVLFYFIIRLRASCHVADTPPCTL